MAGASKKPEPEQRLSDAQRLAWLRLLRSENVGPATFRALVNQFGGAQAAIDALPDLSRRGGRTHAIRLCSIGDAEAELARAKRIGADLVAHGERGYPPALAHADGSPRLIYVKARLELGSAAGQKFTRQIANALGLEGFVIASGLARGIDTAAHKASLDNGTIAVVAGGIDIVYPPENADLQAAIGEQGLRVSERSPGHTPRAKDFPRRNRLISGIALGVVVIEAAQRSGSLITARLAGEQGREVFAVPGSPLDPRAAGTNNLLKQGATLVTTPEDITQALAPMLGRPTAPGPRELSSHGEQEVPRPLPDIGQTERDRVIEALGPSPIDIDEILRCTGIETRKLHIILLELDLAGRLQRHPRQLVSLIDPKPGPTLPRPLGLFLIRGNLLCFFQGHPDVIGQIGHIVLERVYQQFRKQVRHIVDRLLARD